MEFVCSLGVETFLKESALRGRIALPGKESRRKIRSAFIAILNLLSTISLIRGLFPSSSSRYDSSLTRTFGTKVPA
jgi:hypothetical protein